jgi:hypothetical protein
MDLREIVCENVDWIHPAEDIDEWKVVVDTINDWIP